MDKSLDDLIAEQRAKGNRSSDRKDKERGRDRPDTRRSGRPDTRRDGRKQDAAGPPPRDPAYYMVSSCCCAALHWLPLRGQLCLTC